MTLTISEYHDGADSTAVYSGRGSTEGLVYAVLGLNGEAGELAEKAKKCLRDDGGVLLEERRRAMVLELGDVFWYLAALATELGEDLEHVAEQNLAKLASRKQRDVLGGDGDDR